MRSTSLLLLLGLLACGGSAPASAPPQLDLPVPPGARAAGPRCPPVAGPPRAESRPEMMRPPVARIPVSPAIQALVDAADRDAEDKKIDAGRHPGELLAFLALRPGDRVADLGAGGGYSTELFARAVGPRGRVYSENPALFVKFADKPWGERLKKLKNVVRVDRELDAPLPPDAKNLDAVVNVLVYHDSVWMGVDRDKMNKAVFDALKHGGEYVIVDHSAPEGTGTQGVKTIHRIDELFVIRDIEKAGFHHVGTGDFLRNPADTRDWNDSPREAGERRGTSDRFVLKFIKP
ncbi:MAG TPA: SAM-dependent methyltransferase [Polyangiaceae bacterium]